LIKKKTYMNWLCLVGAKFSLEIVFFARRRETLLISAQRCFFQCRCVFLLLSGWL
jgi:hypothetical protein